MIGKGDLELVVAVTAGACLGMWVLLHFRCVMMQVGEGVSYSGEKRQDCTLNNLMGDGQVQVFGKK